jgi:predicted phosphoadenosine phosphosulfate sulfurtransferase
MNKVYQEQNVWDATQERLAYIFREFDNVLVAFSAGKDSGVMLNAAYRYAKETGQLSKLAFYYMDYEAGYRHTHEYAQRTFDSLTECRRYWLCLPISAACAVSMHQTSWTPWDADQKAIWVREMPTGGYVVSEDNCQFQFTKGIKGFDARIDFAKWFAAKHGKTAVLVGIRADESLSRLAMITSARRSSMYKGIRHSSVVDEKKVNFWPIYDWGVEDVWVANGKLGFDYNKIYDLFYKAGLSLPQMRVASPFHQCGQESLHLFKVIDPDSWAKMVGRVNGVNFTAIYGGTTAMGWRRITKPPHFTWKQYAEFLLSTLPDATRKKYETKIAKSQWHWREQGGARGAEFIAQIEKEGWKIRRTGIKRGKNNDEVVFIDEMMDDTAVDEFRKAPTWKRVCVAIMRNDVNCLYMGFKRTKGQAQRRLEAMKIFNESK